MLAVSILVELVLASAPIACLASLRLQHGPRLAWQSSYGSKCPAAVAGIEDDRQGHANLLAEGIGNKR